MGLWRDGHAGFSYSVDFEGVWKILEVGPVQCRHEALCISVVLVINIKYVFPTDDQHRVPYIFAWIERLRRYWGLTDSKYNRRDVTVFGEVIVPLTLAAVHSPLFRRGDT